MHLVYHNLQLHLLHHRIDYHHLDHRYYLEVEKLVEYYLILLVYLVHLRHLSHHSYHYLQNMAQDHKLLLRHRRLQQMIFQKHLTLNLYYQQLQLMDHRCERHLHRS